MSKLFISEKQIWEWLEEVPDPEIPVLSVIDLGVIRKVEIQNQNATITITPTYTGCPAMKQFEDDIVTQLKRKGFEQVKVITVFSPAWTTDWINDNALKKLEKYGIAPPVKGTQDKGVLFAQETKKVKCPKCKGYHTELKSQFGATACKSLYFCNECIEPFEHFKCI